MGRSNHRELVSGSIPLTSSICFRQLPGQVLQPKTPWLEYILLTRCLSMAWSIPRISRCECQKAKRFLRTSVCSTIESFCSPPRRFLDGCHKAQCLIDSRRLVHEPRFQRRARSLVEEVKKVRREEIPPSLHARVVCQTWPSALFEPSVFRRQSDDDRSWNDCGLKTTPHVLERQG